MDRAMCTAPYASSATTSIASTPTATATGANDGLGLSQKQTIGPGLRLNVGKRSLGLSAGRRGARVSTNAKGRKGASLSWKGFIWRKSL